jgi:hypothetical protein
MERDYWVKLIVISLFLLLNQSCIKDLFDRNITFSGMVIDQITKEPVSGANVYYGYRPFHETSATVHHTGDSVITGDDGKYEIKVSKKIIENDINYPRQILYAVCDGYIGSDIISPDEGEINLYHHTVLHLHVINDTIKNNIDVVKIWIVGNDHSKWGYPGYIRKVVTLYTSTITCAGRNFDSVLVYNDLWGNVVYNIGGGENYAPGPTYFTTSIVPVPDSVNHLDVSF